MGWEYFPFEIFVGKTFYDRSLEIVSYIENVVFYSYLLCQFFGLYGKLRNRLSFVREMSG